MRPRRTLPLRLWLALALIAIVGLPAIVISGGATLIARPQPPEQVRVAAVQRFLAESVAWWRDPNWQRGAGRQLFRMGVDVQVVDATGHQLFVTPGALKMLQQWGTVTALLLGRTPRPPSLATPLVPPRYVTTVVIPAPASLRSEHPMTNHPPLGIAYLWLAPRPPDWVQTWGLPLAGLAALLLALVAVAVFLERLVLRPLAALSKATRQIAAGDLDIHAPSSAAREVDEVSAGLAVMRGALHNALEHQQALEQERKLFIGAVAHDLRTPLFMLRGYLEGLETRVVTTPEKVAEYVHECRAKADALERLIADLFTFTKVEYLEQEPRRESLELGALLRAAVEGRQLQAEEAGVALVLDGPRTPCALVGDSQMLTRAVENLLENALRHTSAGGQITVSWGADGAGLVWRVADTGAGIAAQDLPHLFMPLYRGEASRNRQTGGAGLGLTIARRILQAHGGDLTAANRAIGGAAFTATLPVDRALLGLPLGNGRSA